MLIAWRINVDVLCASVWSLWYSLTFVYVRYGLLYVFQTFFFLFISLFFNGLDLGRSTRHPQKGSKRNISYKYSKRHYGDTSVYCSSCALTHPFRYNHFNVVDDDWKLHTRYTYISSHNYEFQFFFVFFFSISLLMTRRLCPA